LVHITFKIHILNFMKFY